MWYFPFKYAPIAVTPATAAATGAAILKCWENCSIDIRLVCWLLLLKNFPAVRKDGK
jgi:hypothetical protein